MAAGDDVTCVYDDVTYVYDDVTYVYDDVTWASWACTSVGMRNCQKRPS